MRLRVIGIGCVLLAAAAAFWCLRDRDEARIRAALSRLAAVVSKPAGTQKLAFLGKARALDALFAVDARLSYARKGRRPVEAKGRDTIKGLYVQVFRRVKRFEVSFKDVQVEIAEGRRTATALLTGQVDRWLPDGSVEVDVAELRFRWAAAEGEWRIEAVEWVEVFR